VLYTSGSETTEISKKKISKAHPSPIGVLQAIQQSSEAGWDQARTLDSPDVKPWLGAVVTKVYTLLLKGAHSVIRSCRPDRLVLRTLILIFSRLRTYERMQILSVWFV